MDTGNFLDRLKKRRPDTKASSEWAELVGEITDYLNANRGKYGPWTAKFVGQKVAYIYKAAGVGELRLFVKTLKEKGSWYFWWVVNPKNNKR